MALVIAMTVQSLDRPSLAPKAPPFAVVRHPETHGVGAQLVIYPGEGPCPGLALGKTSRSALSRGTAGCLRPRGQADGARWAVAGDRTCCGGPGVSCHPPEATAADDLQLCRFPAQIDCQLPIQMLRGTICAFPLPPPSGWGRKKVVPIGKGVQEP